jgi:hypothetical protein
VIKEIGFIKEKKEAHHRGDKINNASLTTGKISQQATSTKWTLAGVQHVLSKNKTGRFGILSQQGKASLSCTK